MRPPVRITHGESARRRRLRSHENWSLDHAKKQMGNSRESRLQAGFGFVGAVLLVAYVVGVMGAK